MSVHERCLGDAGFDSSDLDLDLADLELLDDVDLDDVDVVEVWHSLRPADRFVFADRVYTYGTPQQSSAIVELANLDPGESWADDQAPFGFDGGDVS